MDILRSNQVDIWYGSTELLKQARVEETAHQLLAETEKLQYEKFAFVNMKKLYLISRYLLRTKLSQYHKRIEPKDWKFKLNQYGRPEVANKEVKMLHFNFSHSGDYVACAFSTNPAVGIDIECMDRRGSFLDIAAHSFSKIEYEKIRSLQTVEEQTSQFFRIWTLKESYIKARGMGLSLPIQKFSFNLLSNGQITVNFEAQMKEDPTKWKFALMNPAPGYQAAVALGTQENLALSEHHLGS